jgi:hypothetical protein
VTVEKSDVIVDQVALEEDREDLIVIKGVEVLLTNVDHQILIKIKEGTVDLRTVASEVETMIKRRKTHVAEVNHNKSIVLDLQKIRIRIKK